MGADWLPRPGTVGARIWDWAVDGSLLHDTAVTFGEGAAGMILGGLGGAALPFLLRLSPRLMKASEPFLSAAFGVPKLALAPLFILWLGIGVMTKVVFVASIVFFLMFYNGMAGILSVDPRLVAMARVAGASQWVITREIVWHTTLPFLFAGLKIALPRALSGAVVGEFIAADAGLGWYINNARSLNDTTGVVAGAIVVTFLVVLVNAGLQRVQARSLAWRPVSRDMVV
jgi:NitT/TauT family transport system permease protein